MKGPKGSSHLAWLLLWGLVVHICAVPPPSLPPAQGARLDNLNRIFLPLYQQEYPERVATSNQYAVLTFDDAGLNANDQMQPCPSSSSFRDQNPTNYVVRSWEQMKRYRRHAEVIIITDYFQGMLERYRATHGTPPRTVNLFTYNSPCRDRCAQNIANMANNHQDITFYVGYNQVYIQDEGRPFDEVLEILSHTSNLYFGDVAGTSQTVTQPPQPRDELRRKRSTNEGMCWFKETSALGYFEKLARNDCNGGDDFETVTGTTPERCAAHCLSIPQCIAFDFTTDNKCYPTRKCVSTTSRPHVDAYVQRALKDFEKVPSNDCDGGDDFETVTGTTPERCASRCLSIPQCVGFDFNGDNNCYPTRLCDTTSSARRVDAYVRRLALKDFEKVPSNDCNGGDDFETVTGTTPERCAAHCLSIPQCVAFDFTRDNYCYPTRNCVSTTSRPRVDAYVRRQGK